MVVFHVFDNSSIKLVTIKNQTQGELLRTYTEVYDYITTRVYKQQLHKIDHNKSKEVELFIENQQTKYQYISPQMH